MKKILWIIIFCFLLLGCKKNPFDYREKYTGEYIFSVHSVSWIISQGVTLDTTYTYSESVELGSEKNIILISNSEFIIYEDGTIAAPGNGINGCRGEFASTKKVIYSCSSGGLGGGSNITVTGEKK